MKRLFIIIAISMATATAAMAQESTDQVNQTTEGTEDAATALVPGMKYRNLKHIYDYKDYQPFIYESRSPGGMGVASFFIPGLGQMISGEIGRGLAWMGGSMGAYLVMGVGGASMSSAEYYGESDSTAATIIYLVGFTSLLAVDICCIVDAVRVAKVKNMYERDLYKKLYSFDLDLHPSVNYILTPTGTQPTAGFTFALNF